MFETSLYEANLCEAKNLKNFLQPNYRNKKYKQSAIIF